MQHLNFFFCRSLRTIPIASTARNAEPKRILIPVTAVVDAAGGTLPEVRCTGTGVGCSEGAGDGLGEGRSVGNGDGTKVGLGVGTGIGAGVGVKVGLGVAV